MEFSKECVGIEVRVMKDKVDTGPNFIIQIGTMQGRCDFICIPLSQLQQLIDMLNELNNAIAMNDEHEHLMNIEQTKKMLSGMNKDLTKDVPGISASSVEVGNRLAMLSQGVDPETVEKVIKGRKQGAVKKRNEHLAKRPITVREEEGFNRFWAIYPRKVGKGLARASWAKLDPSTAMLAKILLAVEAQRYSEQWKRDKGQYIPLPATWLNQERWEDEAEINNEPRRKPTWKEVAEARHLKAMHKATVSDSPASPDGGTQELTPENLGKILKTTVSEQEDTSSNGKTSDDKTVAL